MNRFLISTFLLGFGLSAGAEVHETKVTSKMPVTNVVKGIYFNEMSQIITYESTIPINFILELPSISPPHSTFSCDATPYLCSLHNKTMEMTNLWMEELVEDHPYLLQDKPRSERALFDFIGEVQKFMYGVATVTDVTKLHVDLNFIRNREKQVEDAIISSQKYILEFSKNISSYSSKLKKVFEEDLEQVRQKISEYSVTTLKNEAVLAEISTRSLFHQYISLVSQQMLTTGNDCRNHLIPRNVLPNDLLVKRIFKLADDIQVHGYEIATTIDNLWKLEIADCWFSQKQLQITVHVPIKKKGHQIKLFEVVKLPFQFEEKQCLLMDSSHYVAVQEQFKKAIAVGPHMSRFCRPEEKRLCLVPEHTRNPSSFSKCTEKILFGTAADITAECMFECHVSNETRITEISQGLLGATNVKSITFRCSECEKISKYEVSHNYGAVLFRIPCGYTAEINDDGFLLNAPFPCTSNNDIDEETVKQVIPTHFSKIKGSIFDSDFSYLNLSDLIDLTWHQKLPVLELPQPTLIQFSQAELLETLNGDFFDSKIAVYVWLLLLTFCIAVIGVYYVYSKAGVSSSGILSPQMMGLLLFLPGVFGSPLPIEVPTASEAFWNLIRAFEITNIILGVTGGLVGLILLMFLWRIYKFVSNTYKLMRQFVTADIDLPEFRRRR